MKRIILKDEESRYVIDDKGNVFGSRGYLKPILWSTGYLMYSFNHKNTKVRIQAHRLVAMYCLGDVPSNYQELVVNHKNGIKTDNSPSNLEWVTQEENILHEFETGLAKGTPFISFNVYKGDTFIGKFNSINSCAKTLKLNSGNIHNSLHKGHKCKGYSFYKI